MNSTCDEECDQVRPGTCRHALTDLIEVEYDTGEFDEEDLELADLDEEEDESLDGCWQ